MDVNQSSTKVPGGVFNLEDVMLDEHAMNKNLGGGILDNAMDDTYDAQNKLSPFKGPLLDESNYTQDN